MPARVNRKLLDLLENLPLLPLSKQKEVVRAIEQQYPSKMIQTAQQQMSSQFRSADRQFKRFEKAMDLFTGAGSNSVNNAEVDQLVSQMQNEVTSDLIKQLPSVPTHDPGDSKNPKNQMPSPPTHVPEQKKEGPSRQPSKPTYIDQLQQRSDQATEQARIDVDRYKQKNTPDNRRRAIKSLEIAETLKGKLQQAQKKADAKSKTAEQTKPSLPQEVKASPHVAKLLQTSDDYRNRAKKSYQSAKQLVERAKKTGRPIDRQRAGQAIKQVKTLQSHARRLERQANALKKAGTNMQRFKQNVEKIKPDSKRQKTKEADNTDRGPSFK